MTYKMSTLVTEHIVRVAGDVFYSIKEDGKRDSTWQESDSAVLWFFDANNEIKEQILTTATADEGEVKTPTQTVIPKLTA